MANREQLVKVGVISDTHGLIRPVAFRALMGSDMIVHAGDIGTPAVLDALREIAPVVAVRGNCDRGSWADALPEVATLEAGGVRFLVIHNVKELDRTTLTPETRCVISGLTHKADISHEGMVLYLNPGSAGPRRFSLPVTVARIEVRSGVVNADMLALEVEHR